MNTQTKLHDQHHFNWASYVHEFHLVSMYKKGSNHKIADMLNHHPICALTILNINGRTYEEWKQQYAFDP